MTPNHNQLEMEEKRPLAAAPIETLLETFPESEFANYDLGNPETPVYNHKAEIIDALRDNQVVIVEAATGSGKSTQVPQICLEAGYRNITLTQPRRRAAIGVAERIEYELSGELGPFEAANLVSCQTGAGLKGPADATIKVVTDGLHLARDSFDRGQSGPDVLMVDEVHEWNNNIELIGPLAMKRIQRDPQFRLLIMSATIQSDELAKHFKRKYDIDPAIVQIEGRMHQVAHREESKSTVAAEAVKAAREIHKNPEANGNSNTVLVVVAGKQEIEDTIDELRAKLPPEILSKTKLAPLHAQMAEDDQKPAFNDLADGIKIVVSTNLCQTSLTIPKTRYVISSGLERREELDDEGVRGLMLRPASQDALRQQAGRTGRTNDGYFILTRQNSRTPFVGMEKRPRHTVPEIKRSQLDRAVLQTACGGEDLRVLGTKNSIPFKNIQRARRRLHLLGALGENGQPTSLGRRMNRYPLSPSLARSMIHAESFPPNVRGYMAMIVSAKEAGGIRLFERGRGRRWQELSQETSSDDLAQLDAFLAAQSMSPQERYDHDFDTDKLAKAFEQYRKVAKRAGADPSALLKVPTQEEREQLRECILVGSVNDIFLPEGEGLWRLLGGSIVPRELSNRSLVQAIGGVIVGEPRRIEIKREGKTEIKQIVENATKVSFAALGRVATHHIVRVHTGYRLRGRDQFVSVETDYIAGHKLNEYERAADPSPQLRQMVIEQVRNKPGAQLRELDAIKKELERLAHKTKRPFKLLTQDDINELINASAPDDITDASLVDHNLRLLVQERGIKLDKYLSPTERQTIEDNAPPYITVAETGATLDLRYVKGQPRVRRYNLSDLEKIDGDLRLNDGRLVYFYVGNKRYTSSQALRVAAAEARL